MKVILIKVDQVFYALKAVNKMANIDVRIIDSNFKRKLVVDYKKYLKEHFFEKEVGLLGNECRFLVKLINSFQTEVNIKIYK
jgi:hypothetical protein